MTTVTTLAQSLSAHPGPWNGGYGWFPFFPFFGFFFFLLFLFLVFGIFGRRRMVGPSAAPRRRALGGVRPGPPLRRGGDRREGVRAADLDAAPARPGLTPGHRPLRDGVGGASRRRTHPVAAG